MGTGRGRDKDKQKEKIPIAKRLDVDTKEVYNSLIAFYKKLADGCIIDAVNLVMENISDTTIKYFFVIGLMEFTKKYYGDCDDFKFKW